MLRLSATHDHQVREVVVPPEATQLGAATDCGVHVPFPGVSRHHARVQPVSGGVLLTDLGSKNGLRQRGRHLREVTLRPGDSVQLGKARLTLEEVDTSDTVLGEGGRPASRGPAPERVEDTDTVASDGSDNTPAEALRLLREIEFASADLASPRGRDLVDRAVRVLGAVSLFVVSPAAHGAALRQAHGAVPSEADANKALELVSTARAEEILSVEAGEGLFVVACRMGSSASAPVLGALLKSPGKGVRPWRRDLFAYIAHRMTPPPARRAAPGRPIATAALVLPEGFVRGRAPATLRLLDQLQAAVRSDLDVLILGETGVGKEFVARIIHDSGPTARGPFVAINCAAIPSEMLEAELFGVKARIATGVDPRPGLLTRAHDGCIFLDEIGDMPEALQAKLLRALQEREVMPIGAHQPEPIHVRVLSSTNKDLTGLVRVGRFRADLYFRLRGLEFSIPPLRDRIEDVPLLALAFADRSARSHSKDVAGISRRALNLLEGHDWPGNVRELRSEVERAVLLCPDGGTLSSRYFESLHHAMVGGDTGPIVRLGDEERGVAGAASPRPSAPPQPGDSKLATRVDEVESRAIHEALVATHGNRTLAAKMLGITRNGLALKMKRLGIDPTI